MPNYIKNRLTIIGTNEQIKEVFEKYNTHIPAKLYTAYDGRIVCKNKENNVGWYDLKTGVFCTGDKNSDTVGLPENWHMKIRHAIDVFPDFKKIIPPPYDDAYNDLPTQEVAQQSHNWWHKWNTENWGTKLDLTDPASEQYGTYTFDTAWNGVAKLMLILSKQNPGIEFHYEYADENTGYNCAAYKFKDGEVLEAFKPDAGSIEAYELSFKLRPYVKGYFILIDGEYKYK